MKRPDYYQSLIEQEAFVMKSLMREAQFAREANEYAFNKTYQFTPDPVDEVFREKKEMIEIYIYTSSDYKPNCWP